MLAGMYLTNEEQIKAYWYVNPFTRLPDFFVGVLLYQFYRSLCNKKPCYYWLPVSLIILIFALQQGGISRLLSNRFLIIGGEISYSFYLIHLFIIDAYMRMSAHYHWQIQWTISVPVILCITIILSLLSFYYFEKPANKWVKRIFTKKTIINQPHGIINKNTTN